MISPFGASYAFTRAYTVQAGDPDPLLNTATVTTSPVGFPNVISDSDEASTNLFQPSITIDKTGDTLSKVGDVVNYTITVTNTSSTTGRTSSVPWWTRCSGSTRPSIWRLAMS